MHRVPHLLYTLVGAQQVLFAVLRNAVSGSLASGQIYQNIRDSLEVSLVAPSGTHRRVVSPEYIHDLLRELDVTREVYRYNYELRAKLPGNELCSVKEGQFDRNRNEC